MLQAGGVLLVRLRRHHLRPKPGVQYLGRELKDVDGRQEVVRHYPVGYDYGVLKVVPVPGHEGHGQVPSEGDLPTDRGQALGQYVPLPHLLPLPDAGDVVYDGVLSGPLKHPEVVGLQVELRPLRTDHYLVVVYVGHLAVLFRHHHGPAIPGYLLLHTRTHQGGLRVEERNGLTLHV